MSIDPTLSTGFCSSYGKLPAVCGVNDAKIQFVLFLFTQSFILLNCIKSKKRITIG